MKYLNIRDCTVDNEENKLDNMFVDALVAVADILL